MQAAMVRITAGGRPRRAGGGTEVQRTMITLSACTRWALPPLLFAATAFAAPAQAPVPSSDEAAHASPQVELRLPADIVFAHRGSPDSAVVFSHQSHVTPGENTCLQCHNGSYSLLKRGPAPTHGTMNAGGSCGACHDGKHSFGVKDATACGNCHTGVQAASAAKSSKSAGADSALTAAPRLPKPHAYPQGDGSPGLVTFKHKTHVKDAADCASCHPKPFRKMAAAPLADGAMHDAVGCGSCHNGKKSFATDDDAKCARCHRETGARP
jgi:c(7)-type cytochrome triheme protein